ncbi:hypothetical protein P8625_04860 [Tenacibaculum tangerinum]|uniref:Abnormal spindle-like microcephaly-associated protein ASH domain-containing protein n=1 Tax=Tenacibaculum tangerinum TaxID=3038772 RepID=A0ABY8L501_9FLAO|nr:hypothetical protein [Tenacibaculum tangerinum]WGH76493.1 hypothetical protein P8625_04860 [Tenacibaculum tangerinum]
MKISKISLLLLFAFITLTSCFQDEDNTFSCVSPNISNNSEAEIYTSKSIEATLSNECDTAVTVTKISVGGQHAEDFKVQGLSVGTNITKNTDFTIVFTPTQLGTRNVIISIIHDVGEIVINLSAEGV